MNMFYRIPYYGTLVLLSAMILIGLLQAYCMVYGFFRFRYARKNRWGTVLEGAVLSELCILIYFGAEAVYHIKDGYVVIHSLKLLRYVHFGLLLILTIGTIRAEKSLRPLSVPIIGSLTLPVLDPWSLELLPLAVCLWLLRSAQSLLRYRRERKNSLTAFSVKEAVDTLDFGLLYCRAEGSSQGQILLANREMQELMESLIGRQVYNGKQFYERLLAGEVLPQCIRRDMEDSIVYQMPDGRVWVFDLEYIGVKGDTCALLTASDITQYSWTNDRLSEQNRKLEERNRELKAMLQNMESICRTEQTLQAKSRVHDLLGQQISLVLRSVREHREPEEALLRSFETGLPEQLKNAAEDCENSLRRIAGSFRSLGVAVEIQGSLPPQPELQKAFYEIAAEAMTNAVHHGYATKIEIGINREAGAWILTVRDNGSMKPDKVIEGGGLQSMRRKARELGGEFAYTIAPHFVISVKVPEGEAV